MELGNFELSFLATAVSIVSASYAQAETTSDNTIQLDQVVITALPTNKTPEQILEPVAVVSGEDLANKRGLPLGKILDGELGVHNAGFGEGVGLPIVRGLSGSRVGVLQDGLGARDASNVSADHAAAVNAQTAGQIEILRGPQTLLYGSNAFAGVINVVSEQPLYEGVETTVEAQYGTADRSKQGTLQQVGRKGNIGWDLGLSEFSSDSYELPNGYEVEHDEEEHEGEEHDSERLENSDIGLRREINTGLTYFTDKGSIVARISALESEFGLPGHGGHHGEEHEGEEHEGEEQEGEEHEEEAARVELEQQRFALGYRQTDVSNAITGLKADISYTDYEHAEGEGEGEDVTRFDNKGIDGRVELTFAPVAGVYQTAGVQLGSGEFGAAGEESFVAPTDTQEIGVFYLAEGSFNGYNVKSGLRFDSVELEAEFFENDECEKTAADFGKRSFSDVSGSIGVDRFFGQASDGQAGPLQLGVSVTSAARAPEVEEMFACGDHHAIGAIEIGNGELESERALNLEFNLSYQAAAVTAELNAFYNQVNNFIYTEHEEHEEEVTLPLPGVEEHDEETLVFTQQDAIISGFEARVGYAFTEQLALTLQADSVRGRFDEGEEGRLPRLPADRAGLELSFDGALVNASLSATHVRVQDRLAEEETRTDGYNNIEASISRLWNINGREFTVGLYGSNLGDDVITEHTSYVKGDVVAQGRSYRFSVSSTF